MRGVLLGSLLALMTCAGLAAAQEVSLDGRWFTVDALPPEVENGTPWIRPSKGHQVLLDVDSMKRTLIAAPLEHMGQAPIIVWLPKPDGTFERFRVVESPIMLPDLAAQLPDVKTYAGQGVDDPHASVRFDMTPAGFHAQVLSVNGAYYIDPSTQGNTDYYTSYYKRDYARALGESWRCLVSDTGQQLEVPASGFSPRVTLSLSTLRVAIAATAEFTAYHSLTTDTDAVKRTKAQAAITTLMNRVNGIYENELQVRLPLVNNTNIIYTNSATDPYTDSDVNQMFSVNTSTINTAVGSANYDVGHVVGRTGGGGVAGLGVVCSANKGRGVSCFSPPIGDPFAVDYIAHEMGHQFNGQHSFAGCNGNAGTSGWRYEPGSGSTIMAYAGICGADNLQSNSDPFFHHENIVSMRAYIAGLACDGTLASTNNIPTLTAPGLTYVIPQQTPFALTVTSAADSDGDPLTYSWEQSDSATTATAAALSQGDLGTNPIFRARAPVTSRTRFFPALDDVIDGTRDAGEFLPQAARTMSFRATVRDNRVGGGGVAVQPSGAGAETRVTISTAAGPFTVTNPTGNPLLAAGSLFSLTWNVANTNVTPVNCANVDILLSTDGGLTFPTVVLANTPNDGAQAVTVPSVSTNTARFMVRAVGNVFFNVSPAFRVSVPAPPTPTNLSASPNPFCTGQSVTLNATVGSGETVDWYRVGCSGTPIGTGTTLLLTAPQGGTYFARTRRLSDGATSSTCAGIVVGLGATPTTPSGLSVSRNNFCSDDSGTITLSATGGTGTTLRWFADACETASIGTGSAIIIPSPQVSTTYFCRWETACGNSTCASVRVTVNPASAAPTSVSVDRDTFCAVDAGVITLTASGGSGTYEWFADACGTAPIGTGSPLVIDSPAVSTTYFVRTTGACGASACLSTSVNVGTSDIDFNNNGIFPEDQDIVDFFDVLAGGDCPACRSIDFNGDGVFPDDGDAVDFFNVLAGGGC
jgi:hypothetical protein